MALPESCAGICRGRFLLLRVRREPRELVSMGMAACRSLPVNGEALSEKRWSGVGPEAGSPLKNGPMD